MNSISSMIDLPTEPTAIHERDGTPDDAADDFRELSTAYGISVYPKRIATAIAASLDQLTVFVHSIFRKIFH